MEDGEALRSRLIPLNSGTCLKKARRSLVIQEYINLKQKDGHLQKAIQPAGDVSHLQELFIIFYCTHSNYVPRDRL